MDCKYHPGHEADLTCIQCGQQFCRECVREKKATHYCPDCHQAELERFSQKLGLSEPAPKVKKEKVPKQKVAKEPPLEEAPLPPVKEKKSRQLKKPQETPSEVPPLVAADMAAPPPPAPSITPEEKADFWGDIQEPKRRRRGRDQQLPPPPSFEPVPLEEEPPAQGVAAFEQAAPPPPQPVQQPVVQAPVQEAPVAPPPVPPAPVAPEPVRPEPVRSEQVIPEPVPRAPAQRPPVGPTPLSAPPLTSEPVRQQSAPVEPSKTVEPAMADTMVPLTRPKGSRSIQKPEDREKAVMTAEGFPVGGLAVVGVGISSGLGDEEDKDGEVIERRVKRKKKSRGPKSRQGDGLVAMQMPDEYNGEVTVHPAYLKALLWGLLAGLIGGGAYAMVAWWRHGEQGILGWLIGLAVGLTVVFASGRHFNWKLGLMAALIAMFWVSAARIGYSMLDVKWNGIITLPIGTWQLFRESLTTFWNNFLSWWLAFFLISGAVAFLVAFRPPPVKLQLSSGETQRRVAGKGA